MPRTPHFTDVAIEAMTVVEGLLEPTARLSLYCLLVTVIVFVGYLALDVLQTRFRLLELGYRFPPLRADPVFDVLAFCCGCLVCLQTGTLIALVRLRGDHRDPRTTAVILLGFVGLGFGAAILKYTAVPAFDAIARFVSVVALPG